MRKFNLAECMHTPDGEVPNVARGTRVLSRKSESRHAVNERDTAEVRIVSHCFDVIQIRPLMSRMDWKNKSRLNLKL